MERATKEQPHEHRSLVARMWKRMAERNRARRRTVKTVGYKRRAENRFLPSLYEIWRMLAGTHESSPK